MQNHDYFKWYLKWYTREIRCNAYVMISPPSLILPNFIKGSETIVIQAFSRFRKDLDPSKYLQELLNEGDNMGIIFYINYDTTYHSLDVESYEGYGFEKFNYPNWYVRYPNH